VCFGCFGGCSEHDCSIIWVEISRISMTVRVLRLFKKKLSFTNFDGKLVAFCDQIN
jgi:hypothetical protein